MSWKYEDMLYLPRHISTKHPPMSQADRAAQFSPYAALTGHDAVIRETARLVDQPVELSESRRAELNAQLQELENYLDNKVTVRLTHYVPDLRKQGGSYVVTTGCVRKLDVIAGVVVLTDGSGIAMEDIVELDWESRENP
jgi:hypothetical protein